MAEVRFPPYGAFAAVYENSVDASALAPPAWSPQLPLAEREATWTRWRDETVEIITKTLWPKWNPADQDWLNGDASHMLALTLADFDLFGQINSLGLLETMPQTSVSAASIPSHRQYFLDEDTGKLGDRYYFYDHTLPASQLEMLPGDLRAGLKEKAGSVSIQFKQLIQRPRAYQVAKILGRAHKFELAATSMTSSMTSGHCFQGCFLAASIYEAWLNRGFAPTDQQVEALEHFGVDIGDRRTFAGVHYPSDNMSSWILSLRLGKEVFNDRRVWKFLAEGIQKRSKVYDLVASSNSSPYAGALSEIDKLAAEMLASV